MNPTPSQHAEPFLNRLMRFCLASAVLVVVLFPLCQSTFADEVVLDETMTESRNLGDFNVSIFDAAVDLNQEALVFDSGGFVDAGQLYNYFKSRGLTEVNELHLCLDCDTSDRVDRAFSNVELSIVDENASIEQLYQLGDGNVLRLPSYENSVWKPEAGLTIKLPYDFMKRFNEESRQKLRFTVDGKEASALSMQAAFIAIPTGYFSISRFLLLVAFVVFWASVFVVLFRTTTSRGSIASV